MLHASRQVFHAMHNCVSGQANIVDVLQSSWAHYSCNLSETLLYKVTICERFPMLSNHQSYLITGCCSIFLLFVGTEKALSLSLYGSCHLLNFLLLLGTSAKFIFLMFHFKVSLHIVFLHHCNSFVADQGNTLYFDFCKIFSFPPCLKFPALAVYFPFHFLVCHFSTDHWQSNPSNCWFCSTQNDSSKIVLQLLFMTPQITENIEN